MLKNSFKTAILLASLGGLIVGVATLLGNGSSGAIMIGLVIALAMVGGSYWFSDRLALRAAQAQIITEQDNPQFYRMVAELSVKANLPMPRVAISVSEQPNAFATGRNPKHAVVCATTGLLNSLSPAEVRGVMAHELMHVRNRDILIGSVAAAIATAISSIAQMAMFATMFAGSNDEDRPNPIAVLAVSLIAPIAAGLIQMAVSRSREFEADRSAAELIGTGVPLASALEKIEVLALRHPMMVSPAQAQAYIHNPLTELRRGPGRSSGVDVAKLFSTHPSTEERIRRLRALG